MAFVRRHNFPKIDEGKFEREWKQTKEEKMKENANSENGTSFTHEKFFETSWVEMRCVAAAETHESRVCKLAIFCADSFLIPIVNGNFSLFRHYS